MKRTIAAVCTAVLALGIGFAATPAFADETPPVDPVVVAPEAPAEEAPPADPPAPPVEGAVPPVEDTAPVVDPAVEAPAEEPATEPVPEVTEDAFRVNSYESVVETSYHLVGWLAGAAPPHHFDSDQHTQTDGSWSVDNLVSKNLNALDGFLETREASLGCNAVEDWQIDGYLDDSYTDALIAGGVLHGPNDPTEHLWGGGEGTAWKFVHLVAPASACDVTPGAPSFEDYCVSAHPVEGEVGWKVTGADDTETVDYTIEVDTASHRVRVVAVSIAPYVLASGEDKDVWKFDYTDALCVTEQVCESHDTLPTATDENPMGWGDLLNGTWVPGGIQLTATASEEAYAYLDFPSTIKLSTTPGSLDTVYSNLTGSYGVIIHSAQANIHYDEDGRYWTTTPGVFPMVAPGFYSSYDVEDAMVDADIDEIAVWVNPGGSLLLHSQEYPCVVQPFSAAPRVTPESPTTEDACGVENDTLTIPGNKDGERWYTEDGYYSVKDHREGGIGEVKVIFHPYEGNVVTEPGEGDTYTLWNGKAVWKFEYTDEACPTPTPTPTPTPVVPTLAVTGQSPDGGLIAGGVLLGLGLIAFAVGVLRRRVINRS